MFLFLFLFLFLLAFFLFVVHLLFTVVAFEHTALIHLEGRVCGWSERTILPWLQLCLPCACFLELLH